MDLECLFEMDQTYLSSLSPKASSVGASTVAFAKVSIKFVTWYPQQLHSISTMGSTIAYLRSVSDTVAGE